MTVYAERVYEQIIPIVIRAVVKRNNFLSGIFITTYIKRYLETRPKIATLAAWALKLASYEAEKFNS
jgi:hypothetical protein